MQLLPILLVLPILFADGVALPGGPPAPEAATPLRAIALPAAIVLAAWVAVRILLRGLDRTRRGIWLARADRALGLARLAILAAGAWSILSDGWLAWVRGAVGDLVLADELLALAPVVAGLCGTWAVQHALETRVRDAMRLRRLDEGRPIWPTPSRPRFVIGQLRLQLGLLGVPILLVLGLAEAARMAVDAAGGAVPSWTADAASLGAAALVFSLAPLAMRLVLPIAPMPAGTVREDMVSMCRRLGVRVGDVMLWRTDGTLVNAAVVGVIPSVRYVLLTDAMVEQVPRPALRAVIAHELAHVHHRHVPWLVATLAGMLSLAGAAAAAPATALVADGHAPQGALVGWTVGLAGLAALAAVGIAFGWVSRRYERQADTYAVQAMSREPHWARPGGPEPAASLAVPAAGAVRPPTFLTVGDLRVDARDRGEAGDAEASDAGDGAAGDRAADDGAVEPGDPGGPTDDTGAGADAAADAGRTTSATGAIPEAATSLAAADAIRDAAATPATADASSVSSDAPGGTVPGTSPSPDAAGRVRPEAVLAMNAALGATAALNGVDPRRRSWRHGSIAWRQRYLADLVGEPVDALPIDRLMRRLKMGAAAVLLAGVGATAAVDAWEDAVYESRRGAITGGEADGPRSPIAPLLEFPVARPETDRRRRAPGTEDGT